MTTPVKIVIDVDENDIKSISADRQVEVIVVNSSETALQSYVESSAEDDVLPVIPGELPSTDPTIAHLYEVYEVDVDAEGVREVFDFVSNSNKAASYSRSVMELYKKVLEEDEEEED